MVNLDDPNTYTRLDPQGMGSLIPEMGQQLRDAACLVSAFGHPGPEFSAARNVVILGMGGSAIGGDLVRTLVDDQARVPIAVCRDYRVPAFVGPDSLVIASSYSGGTEETLSATQEAIDRGAKVMAVTTGGKLEAMLQKHGLPVLEFQYKAQPRAALGYSFGLLLGLLSELGYFDESQLGLDEAVATAESAPFSLGSGVPESSNPAKQLARRLHGKLPVVYGGGILSEVARRWKGQFNENSKAWAFFEQLPEANHNAAVGYENPSDLAANLHVILLTASAYHPRTAARVRITAEILRQRAVGHEVVEARGNSPLGQMIDSILTGDYTSYYLAALYETDPTPVKVIDFLKGQLAAIK